jgi:excisionase family DNA binding protein
MAWLRVSRANAEELMMRHASVEVKRLEWAENPSQGPNKDGNNETIGRRLLNVGEAAQYLGVSVDTLHKWVQLRAIPHVKAGRALRFDLVALNRYIDEHTIGTID